MSSQYLIENLIQSLSGKRVLVLATSNRWSGHKETPKSTQLAQEVATRTGGKFIDVSKLHIEICEGNVSTAKGNNCGLKDSALKDTDKNPTGYHRCWASFNNADDELWKISKELFESDVVLFFSSVRWGQTNSTYQRLIERLNWIENRWTTLQEDNVVKNISAGIILIGHNWNGSQVLETQKQVLRYYGFITPENLSFNWQWTSDANDESAAGYVQDPIDFSHDFGLGPVFVKEEYANWFKGFPTFAEIMNEEKIDPEMVNLFKIDPSVVHAISLYFQNHPDAFQHELEASKINPLENPIEYFKYELREPEHKNVRDSINKTGVMTLQDFYNWSIVNAREERERLTKHK